MPFCEAYTDARRNFIVSVILAGMLNSCEVCIFFNKELIRGNRAVKFDNDSLGAFISPNFPPLDRLGVGVTVDETILWPYPRAHETLKVFTRMETNICVMHLVPGFSDECIEKVAESNVRALVLLLYGTGNAPGSAMRKQGFIDSVKLASKKMIIIICTQCLHGATDLNAYGAGRALQQHGVLSAGDMTVEAAVTKISYLLGHEEFRFSDVRSAWQRSLRGDCRRKKQSITKALALPETQLSPTFRN